MGPLASGNGSDFPAASHCSNFALPVGGNNRPKSYYGRGMVWHSIIAVSKNPISCPRLLNVVASSDSIVQTAEPAKMKQLHTVAAVLLLFPNFGLTQHRFFEISLDIQAMDLVYSPDRLLDMGTAFSLIDEICGQVPEESDPTDFIVSGAYNMKNGDFMAWSEYFDTIGKYNGYPRFYWATGDWHTFTGTCSLKPALIWAENSYKSYGSWVWNGARPDGANRLSRLEIRLSGFSAVTETSSWRSRCANVDQMARTFRAMPEIPGEVKKIWKGLDLREESSPVFRQSIRVPYRHFGQAVATTNVLVVQAYLVLNVQRWYWYYEPERSGVSTGWQGMEGLWNYVYADLAWVQASGLVEQRPVDPRKEGVPAWWYCVNMGPENNVYTPAGPAPAEPENTSTS
jgi:hypothetical protein